MTPWLIGILIAVAVVVFLARTRRGSVDESTAAIALESDAPPSSAAATGTWAEPASVTPQPPSGDAVEVRAQTLRALKELAFGTLVPATALVIPASDALCAEVGRTLAHIVDKPNYAPRRPMQLPRLMQAINDETASRGALSQIIAGDPALAGNLLRLANSPYYRHSSEPIESLDRAVAMLGIEGLRSMIAAALLQPVFRTSGGSFAQFGEVTWEYSLFAANAAELHAVKVESADPFAAQLLGLLLGLAHIVVFSVARDAFLAQQRSPDAGLIGALIDAHGVSVARQVASSWELSERIDAALADQLVVRADPRAPAPTPLGRSLHFGEYIGALAVLRQRGAIDDAAALTALQFAPAPAATTERVWGRLGFMPA
jgi:HD-like signal output (HDOD) protein